MAQQATCSTADSVRTVPPAILPEPAALPRVVVFMSAPSADEIPASASRPASLLPFGAVTFAEQVLDSCARAGLKTIDLVVSEQPEALRAHLDDGWRWGLTLNWHLAKESGTPYGFLHALGLAAGQRLLIGHGDRWVSDAVVRALAGDEQVALRIGQGVEWSGWASVTATALKDVPAHADFDLLGAIMVGQPSARSLMVPKDQFARAGTAADLMQAQGVALRNEAGAHLPATWIRKPWGAMSPDASVHPQADIRGPVLIGPRCSVDRQARVGPGAVLSRDVLVARGAVVREALVLPETYLSGGVTLEHSVVQGNVVQDLRWSARMVVPLRDGVLGPLNGGFAPRAGWLGRGLGAGVALTLLPAFALLSLVQRLGGQPSGWIRIDAVVGRDPQSGGLRRVMLRGPHTSAEGASCLKGGYGALLDVVQGRRHWFGIRPREKAQWYALRRDWQVLFNDQPVGLFHAPAWAEPFGPPDGEALAAADAYYIVRASWRERLRMLRGLFRTQRLAFGWRQQLRG